MRDWPRQFCNRWCQESRNGACSHPSRHNIQRSFVPLEPMKIAAKHRGI